MSLINLINNQEKLNRIFKKNSVLLAYIFGSTARGQDTFLSDIDIAVLFSNKVKKRSYSEKILKLADEISEIIKGKEIDIVCLNEASPFLKHRAVFYGKPIFVSNPKLKREFELCVLQEYEDFKYYLERSYKVMADHLNKGIFGKAPFPPKKEKMFLKYVNR